MPRVLVTGGTGVLGREVVSQLAARNTEVRVLTRRPEQKSVPSGAEAIRGDLTTGDGLASALASVDAVVHCAMALPVRNDLDATRRLLGAARAAGSPHIVNVSIVGVDRVLLGPYHAKLACETYVATSGLPWTNQRATQFHDLMLAVLGLLVRGPVASAPKQIQVQPVETAAVASELAGLALGEPAGRVPDLGGPRVERVGDLMQAYLTATGRQARTLPMPLAGKAAAGLRAGGHLLEDGRTVGGTFEEFLRSRVQSDGKVQQSYSLKDYLPLRQARLGAALSKGQ